MLMNFVLPILADCPIKSQGQNDAIFGICLACANKMLLRPSSLRIKASLPFTPTKIAGQT